MKKDIDIESLFKNIQLIKLDPAKEDACQERLKNYFAKLEARERLEEKPVKTTSRPWFAYATACVLLICLVISSVFFYNAQLSIAKEKTRTAILKEYHNKNIFDIVVNLFTQKSVVEFRGKKVVYNLATGKIIKEIYPNYIKLSLEEKELVEYVLNKYRFVYDIHLTNYKNNTSNDYFITFSNDPILNAQFVKPTSAQKEMEKENGYCPTVLTFYSTDPISHMEGYQYPDSDEKYACVEIQPSETYQIDIKDDVIKVYLIVNIDKKIITGPDFEVTKLSLNSKKK